MNSRIHNPQSLLQFPPNLQHSICYKHNTATAFYLHNAEINFKIKRKLRTALTGISFPHFKDVFN